MHNISNSSSKAEQSSIDVMQGESEQSSIAELAESSDYGLQDDESQCGEDQTFGQGELKDVNEYLKGKVGADINAKKWLEGCEGLDDLEKSEVIIRLVYEVCLAKNIEYDLENDAVEDEKGSKRDRNFGTRRIFEILKKVNRLLLPQDRRRFVEFVCQKDNVKLLEMICQQENKVGGGKAKVNEQYSWKGEFTGYQKLTDLLQYVLKQGCSPEIVLCIAKKVYGGAHILFNGEQYLDSRQVAQIKGNFNYSDSVIKDCLKAAIELGYKDVVSVMLGGDIYYCIRLIKGEKFQEGKKVLDMVEEIVAEVMSSWVNDERQSFKDDVRRLLKEGIEIDIEKMGKQELIGELEYLGREVKDKRNTTKEEFEKMLGEEGGGKVRLRKTVVGGLISTLFFNHQDELIKDKEPFELKISLRDKSRREKEINELNEREKNEKKKIDSKSFVKEKVLEKIKLLNSSSHAFNSWFFREVLAAIVNDEGRFNKLKAVCAAICEKPMQELLKGAEVYKDVAGALKFFGVEHNQVTTRKKGCSGCNTAPKFGEDIENLIKGIKELKDPSFMADEVLEIAKGLASNKVPAFSGLSRRTIIKLKNKRDKTDDEAKDLKEKVLKIVDEIKRGVDILAKGVNGEYCIDIEDVFRHFKIINSEIGKEDKREFVELVCQSGNVKLLEMICQQESKDGGGGTRVDNQYSWKGEFTGYERLTDLLQYILEQRCSPEIVLCIAKKVYGNAHIVYNGEQYLDDIQVTRIKGRFDYPDSVIKDRLKAAIELSYKDVVPVMLGGDIYHCIRLIKGEEFQEGKKALKMIEETVVEVMSSWVNGERQSFKDDVQRLLKEGIEIDIEKMDKKGLIDELEYLGREVKDKKNTTKEELVKMLKKEGGGKVRLGKTVVGALISTLSFNYQNELIKNKEPFELGISRQDKSRREKEINELNKREKNEKKKIDSKSFVEEKVLERIKLLNKSSHMRNDWFFREVLAAIVNDEGRFNKLKAVCAAICKEPMERLLKGAKVHKDVVDALGFFGVDPLVLDSPGSKAVKKNNKYFMQNNYRRDREFYYNAGTGSYLNTQSSFREVGMLGNENWDEKLSLLSSSGEDSKLITPDLPEINNLMEVHYAGYKRKLLDKMLDYGRIASSPCSQEGFSREVSRTSDDSINQPRQLGVGYLKDEDLATIETYKKGVSLLKLGQEKEGKKEVKKAADRGFPHARYVYAIITFKEIVQHHMDSKSRLPAQKDIKEAVKCMLHIKQEFFPLPSFVLGVMQSYDQIPVGKKFPAQALTSPHKYLDDVLNDVRYSENNYSVTASRKYIVMEDESQEYLKWIVQSAKYELARGMLLHPEGLSGAKSLLQELSSGDFVDAKCLYALTLLKDTFGDAQNFGKENFDQAYTLLEEATNHGHKEAMFFFGTLPFRQEFKLLDKESQSCKGRCCFSYLRKYIETYGKDGEFKKDAAIFIAAEYVKEKGSYLTYDEEKAKDILRKNDCDYELQELEKKLQERQERAKNVLPDVLGALEQVHSELKKNGEQSAQQLSSKVKELLDALQGSSLIVQQSPLLPSTLEQLRIASTLEQLFLLAPLEQLCCVLELQVDIQSHKEVVSPLQSLFSTCAKLKMEYSHTQYLNPNKPSTTLQMGHSCSISSVSEQGFNPQYHSTMNEAKGVADEGVAGNSALLDDKSISNSNKSHVERELERRSRNNTKKKEYSSIRDRL